mgnify:CR=1 FL=1
MELVQDTHRLALMNMLLHGIEGGVTYGDTLSDDHNQLPPATLILSNPPFGTKKGGGLPTRGDLTFETSNKQFAFLQHIYRALKPGGRAAVVGYFFPESLATAGARVSAALRAASALPTRTTAVH